MNEEKEDPCVIIDCRFNFEYEGGHIKNSINLQSVADLENYFFRSK